MKKLSICIITLTFPPECTSGGGIYSYEVVKRLADHGHDVRVITCLKNTSYYKNSKIKVYSVQSKNLVLFGLFAWKKFRSEIKNQVNILHGNHIYHWLFCLRKPKNIQRIITTTHNSYLQRQQTQKFIKKIFYIPLILLEKTVCNLSDYIIAVSPNTKDNLIKYKLNHSRIKTINNGVDIVKLVPHRTNYINKTFDISRKDLIILFVGRLVKRKNADKLLLALSPLIHKQKNIYCLLVGDGKQKEALKKIVKEKSIEKQIIFMSNVNNEKMVDIYNSSDLFVLPAVGEGLPLSLLEAAACDLPLIATRDATGNSNIIQNGYNGFIVKENNIKDLRSKIKVVIDNIDKYSSKSRQLVENDFTWDKNVKDLEIFYQKALREN